MKKTLVLIFIFLPLLMIAQHFRDRFLGAYNCHAYQTSPNNTYDLGNGWLTVNVSSDTSHIRISINYALGISNHECILFPDSTFQDTILPTLYHGRFDDTDSIYIYANRQSPNTDHFYGKKSVVSISELSSNSIHLYPNPVQYKLIISEAINFNKIEVYNVAGSLHISKKLKNKEQVEVDVSDFEAGVYFVKCSTDLESFVKKIVVQH